jgi:hypothetical protein
MAPCRSAIPLWEERFTIDAQSLSVKSNQWAEWKIFRLAMNDCKLLMINIFIGIMMAIDRGSIKNI